MVLVFSLYMIYLTVKNKVFNLILKYRVHYIFSINGHLSMFDMMQCNVGSIYIPIIDPGAVK